MSKPQSLSELLEQRDRVIEGQDTFPTRLKLHWSDVMVGAAALVIMVVACLQVTPVGARDNLHPVVLKWMQDEAE